MKLKKEKGYTLTEMAIVIALLAIIGSIVAVFYMQIYKSYSKTDAKTKVTQIAIASLGSLQKQLREISQLPSFTPNTTLHPSAGSEVSFYIPSLTDPTNRTADDRIDYFLGQYNGKTVLLQRLVQGADVYDPFPVVFDFDNFRSNTAVIPQGGGVAAFFNDPSLRFDDAAFYYDDTYNMVCIGVTVSVEDRGRKGSREKLTLSSAISIRNTF